MKHNYKGRNLVPIRLIVITLFFASLACSQFFLEEVESEGHDLETPTPLAMEATDTAIPIPTSTSTVTPTPDVGSKVINEIDGATMVFVPEGEFIRGTNDPGAYDFEKPAREIFISAFWMYLTPVTNAQFAQFVDLTGYVTTAEDLEMVPFFAGYGLDVMMLFGAYWNNIGDISPLIPVIEDHPVVYMSWYDAAAYCEWAGGRLPTEAEWEKAARGTDERLFPWGNNPVTGEKANYCDASCAGDWGDELVDDGYRYTSPVGNYPAGVSPYGVLDMAGNVDEWVYDWFEADYYQVSSDFDPPGPEQGQGKSLRGGNYMSGESGLRTWRRENMSPDTPWNTTGFRCAFDVNE